ncbi:hypothetical protein P170DRAFT_488801 [Aspergillus steynii IBT 23096]|uniref:Uncharacterized protein n=1 Tax=Aspergillus steynii IBT 23096 TaxID=1392250 RepID=A0A2I2GH95_9EURO|nr:uncharacterized protein P170DRAFT_488801 [Aspergillus steynii IBT 23096]PLB52253.1 hypothetical protein P170DRAFT_488801 [Aspergillus steynii IBT 23096]
MDTTNELKSKRASIYRHLGQVLSSIESTDELLISLQELRNFGFHPVRVGFDGDELDLSPCFFKPLSASIIDEHPLEDETPESMASEFFEPPGQEGAPSGELEQVAYYVWAHVERLSTASRHGLYRGLDIFASFEPRTYIPGRPVSGRDLWLIGTHPSWETKRDLENPSYPHLELCVLHGILATDEALAITELKAIARALRRRYQDPAFKLHNVVPLLMLSYLAPQHGRIIQAHHDGKNIVVQYTPLMSFEVKSPGEIAEPISLFLRYQLSRPVGSTSRHCRCNCSDSAIL